MKYTLIKRDGTRIQKDDKVSPHIADHEAYCHHSNGRTRHCNRCEVFEPIIELFEKTREIVGKPIKINSFYRCVEKQDELIRDGAKAAKSFPPHCTGAAVDLSIPEGYTMKRFINAVKKAAKELGLPVPRLGHKAYNDSFLHVDLVFMLYEPYVKGCKNPTPAWTEGAEW